MPNTISTAEAVRCWVDKAPAESVLDVREAPGAPSNATRVALSHLASDPRPPIVFVRRHLYWKHRFSAGEADPYAPIDEETGAYDIQHLMAGVDHLKVARHLVGPGGGYAGWTAGWRLGWTKHDAYGFDIAVVGRPPRPFVDNIRFCQRNNDTRRLLTWDETTLLEAVLGFARTDGFDVEYRPGHGWECDYEQTHTEDECLWKWPDPLRGFIKGLRSSGAADHYSPRRLMSAVRAERGTSRGFAEKMSDVADAVADAGRAAA